MMMEIRTKRSVSFGQRCHALNIASGAVRHWATMPGGNYDTWRLSRLMREAHTDAQVGVAERRYSAWLQTFAP
jgi:hypothetical protein